MFIFQFTTYKSGTPATHQLCWFENFLSPAWFLFCLDYECLPPAALKMSVLMIGSQDICLSYDNLRNCQVLVKSNERHFPIYFVRSLWLNLQILLDLLILLHLQFNNFLDSTFWSYLRVCLVSHVTNLYDTIIIEIQRSKNPQCIYVFKVHVSPEENNGSRPFFSLLFLHFLFLVLFLIYQLSSMFSLYTVYSSGRR